eukprot:Sspe_Gene.79274::Locus_49690_Transcript_1_4_Confidence_0.727_Length_731::g.79274::m.79274
MNVVHRAHTELFGRMDDLLEKVQDKAKEKVKVALQLGSGAKQPARVKAAKAGAKRMRSDLIASLNHTTQSQNPSLSLSSLSLLSLSLSLSLRPSFPAALFPLSIDRHKKHIHKKRRRRGAHRRKEVGSPSVRHPTL